MKIQDLRTLFHDELKDAYDFEHQLLEALPKMAERANDSELQRGFLRHLEQTRGQVERLEQVFANLGERPERKTCKGMKGLVKEGDEFVKATGDPAAVDAALIGAAQRVEHYEMAAYGTLRAFARALGRNQDAKLLQATLEEEAQTNERLTKLAEGRVNREAVAGNGAGARSRGNGAARRSRRGGEDGPTRDELYERARKLGVEGRSQMDKEALKRAVQRAGS